MRLPFDSLIFRVVSVATILIIAAITIFSQPNNEDCNSGKNRSTEETHHCELKAHFREALESDPTAYFTEWLVVFTSVLSIVSLVQIGFLIRADGTTRKSADAAKASADALQAVERAFVIEQIYGAQGVGDLFLTGELYKNSPDMNSASYPSPIGIYFKLRNYGKTPATVLTYSIEPIICESVPEFDFVALKTVNYQPKRLLEPVLEASGGETEPIQREWAVRHSFAQSILLAQGSLNLWIIGHITFVDVFDVMRTREFRWLYDRPMRKFVPGQAKNSIDQQPVNKS